MSLKPEGGARYRIAGTPFRGVQRLLLMAIPAVSLLFSFDVPSRMGAAMLQEQFLGIVLILVLTSTFISMPAGAKSSRQKLPWYDAILSLLSLIVGGYLVLYYPRIVNEIGELTQDKVILGWLAIVLAMEACRRMTGWV